MNRFDIGRCHCFYFEVLHNLSTCNPARARKLLVSLSMTLLDGAAHQTVSDVACNSDSEILATLQTVETVESVPTKDIVLTPISFRCFRLVGPDGKDFVAILIFVGLSSGWSP